MSNTETKRDYNRKLKVNSNFKDYTGLVKQNWLVMCDLGTCGEKYKKRHLGIVSCLCGHSDSQNIVMTLTKITESSNKSCKACRPVPKTHHPLYDVYRAMIRRCSEPKDPAYKHYGAIGVKVCDRWLVNYPNGDWEGFNNFLEDMQEGYEKGLSINRKDCALLYSKETCEWDNSAIQNFERRKMTRNKSGRTGVAKCKRINQRGDTVVYYRAFITHQGVKSINLGTYDNFEDAVKAREEGELKYYGFIKSDNLEKDRKG